LRVDSYQGYIQEEMENDAIRNPISNTSQGAIQMMQKLFQSSENKAVAYGVTLFIVFHFGALYLFGLV
jgi:hypothetical protein